MPEFSYEPRTVNDKSALTEGWKPAFLYAIVDEETPAQWKMAEQSPRMWRWQFCVWEVQTLIGKQAPERQSAPTSQKFSPGGKFQPSKAFVWTCELLGRQIQPGERVNLDGLLPLPCRVKIRRNGEYANVVDLEKWPDGAQALTPEFKAQLQAFLAETFTPETQPQPQPPYQPPAPTPAAPAPGMQSWNNPAPAQPATAGKAGW